MRNLGREQRQPHGLRARIASLMLAGTGRRRRAYAGARWPYMRISVASHYYYEEYMILLRREFNLRNTVRRQTVPVRRAAGAARDRACIEHHIILLLLRTPGRAPTHRQCFLLHSSGNIKMRLTFSSV
jgi:hypothetical protein